MRTDKQLLEVLLVIVISILAFTVGFRISSEVHNVCTYETRLVKDLIKYVIEKSKE